MKSPRSKSYEREAMMPLLCAIQAEIVERTRRIEVLEGRQEAFAATPRIHADEIARVRSDLSNQRHELRHVAKELAALGIEFDPEAPRPIVARSAWTSSASGELDRTGFRLWATSSCD